MIISNKKRATGFKRLFFLGGLVMAVFMLVMFLIDKNLYAILTGAAFFVWFFIFQIFDFHYVEFIYENENITVRYYPAVKFGKREYSSIEFSQKILHDFRFETSFFGMLTDLVFVVKTKRGIAEYPGVSLTAVSSGDRKKIREKLNKILDSE